MTKRFVKALVFIAIIVLIVVMVMFSGCTATVKTTEQQVETTIDMGNGVYFVEPSSSIIETKSPIEMANSISQLVASHPNMEIALLSPYIAHNGLTSGYYVILREKRPTEACACNCSTGR